jgi:HD-GYP domain-containing protein (c-di-GMP phosphodiesterase class II)
VREEIPLGSRIILVADAYDAMLSERSYRGSTTAEDAVRELRRMAGYQFDPTVVAALESFLCLEIDHADEKLSESIQLVA